MSVDIYLTDAEGHEVASMNWLRNPLGLGQWISDHTGIRIDAVLPHGVEVDRAEALRVIEAAYQRTRNIEEATLTLRTSTYYGPETVDHLIALGVVEPIQVFDGPNDSSYAVLDQDEFAAAVTNRSWAWGDLTVRRYVAWVYELHEFAQMLQNPEYEYGCSR